MYKKAIIATMTLASISVANASMSDCTEAAQDKDWDRAVEYCEPLANDSREALGYTIGGYGYFRNGKLAQKYAQEYVDKYSTKDPNKEILAGYTASLGNYYYFGEDGADKDIQKGLKYITKGAQLGSPIAERQLGSFYGVEDSGVSKNFVLNYFWTTIAGINGDKQRAEEFNILEQKYSQFKKQYPYCIALGKSLIAESYYEGANSLPVDKSKAMSLMTEATKLSPELSIVNFDMAKMYLEKGDNSKAYEYAQKATKEPYAPAYQFLAQIELQKNTDKDIIKGHLEKAIELYKKPESKYWDKYQAPCRPDFESYPDGYDLASAEKMLASL